MATFQEMLDAFRQGGGGISEQDIALGTENETAGLGILAAKKAYASAKTDAERQAANRSAEEIRRNYGAYTGGSTGGVFNPDRTQETLNELVDFPEFSYNAQTDPLFQQYKKQALREGRRATQDVLGEISSMTGGLPSSYAATAAAQQQQYAGAQIADKIPELYNQKYNEYLNEFSMLGTNLANQTNADASQFEQDFNLANLGAGMGDYTGLQSLGIDTTNYEAMLAAQSSGGSSSSSSSSSGLFADLYSSGSPKTYLINQGYSPSEIGIIMSEYETWLANAEKDYRVAQATPYSAERKEAFSSGTPGGDIRETGYSSYNDLFKS